MSDYSVALFVHIVGVITIFMATAIELLSLHRMRGATTTDQLKGWAGLEKTTKVLFGLGGLPMVFSGAYMASTVWNMSVPWIDLSVATVVVMGVFGPFVNSRRLAAIASALEAAPSGAIPAGITRRVQDPFLLASVHSLAALGFGVVFLKVARPDLAGSLAALVLAVAVGLLSARLASRNKRAPAEIRPSRPATAGEA